MRGPAFHGIAASLKDSGAALALLLHTFVSTLHHSSSVSYNPGCSFGEAQNQFSHALEQSFAKGHWQMDWNQGLNIWFFNLITKCRCSATQLQVGSGFKLQSILHKKRILICPLICLSCNHSILYAKATFFTKAGSQQWWQHGVLAAHPIFVSFFFSIWQADMNY